MYTTHNSGEQYYIHNSVVEDSIMYTTQCIDGEFYAHDTV